MADVNALISILRFGAVKVINNSIVSGFTFGSLKAFSSFLTLASYDTASMGPNLKNIIEKV